jgi:glycosyltransferase involved in cell wall biosynthesis
MSRDGRGAVFVLPTTTADQQGPVASWLSTAGWASAAEHVLGRAWVVTPGGVVDRREVRRRGSDPQLATETASSWRRRVPVVVKTAVKDVRQWQRARRFHVDPTGPWHGHHVEFVWQRHELFHSAGPELARTLGVPSVVFVPAPLVWEAEQWSVPRPWSRWLERVGERPVLTAADLVACGTDMVADQVRRLGVRDDRILVTPTGVDLELFDEGLDRGAARAHLAFGDELVVGWVGSFRRFHGAEQAVEAVTGLDGVALLMVGDGPERPAVAELARARGVRAVFTGTVPQDDLPLRLAAMDVGLVLARPGEAFHYSPLKLAEYLAAGVCVVAPRAGQVAERLSDDVDAVLVPPGDLTALRAALLTLRDDPDRRRRLARGARKTAETAWSWDVQVRAVLEALARRR